jgi:hypothetical protein
VSRWFVFVPSVNQERNRRSAQLFGIIFLKVEIIKTSVTTIISKQFG